MKSFKFQRLCVLLFLVPTVSSLIITSVYAGKKKFKTFSFGTPLLPSVVKVEPNKFHLTFRQYKYLRTPQFKIEGTIPLKAPTIIREKFRPDPNPEVTEFNFGDMSALGLPEANQHVTYDDTQNTPTFVEPPRDTANDPIHSRIPMQSLTDWKPIINPGPTEFSGTSNYFPIHHRIRRFANEYNNQFETNLRNHKMNMANPSTIYQNRQGYPNFMSSYSGLSSHSYASPPFYSNYFNQNGQFSGNSNISPFSNLNSEENPIYHKFNNNGNVYHSNHDMTASSSSFAPPKYQRYSNPPNNQNNNKWIPIVTPSVPSITQTTSSGLSNSLNDQRKVNIGEHYNPSASYVDEKMVEKPTYDPEESEPDEGSISFSISGPHGGEEVPVGYEAQIKQMHEQLKEYPQHIPPGLDVSQIMKYYSQHTFTDPLKTNYGYKPAFGPLGFLKSKLKSWKNILPL